MPDDEDIAEHLLRVDEVVNNIRGFDELLEEVVVAQKVLRSLPKRLNSKASSIEEMMNLSTHSR